MGSRGGDIADEGDHLDDEERVALHAELEASVRRPTGARPRTSAGC